MSTKTIRRTEGFFWLAMGVFICLVSWHIGLGVSKRPGPGFIGFAAGFFMMGIGLVMILAVVFARTASKGRLNFGRLFGSSSWPRIIFKMGLLFSYAVLLERLGYVLTTCLILWGLFFDWGRKNWLSSLLASLAVTGASYLFFVKFLGLPFPVGILAS